jgi:hypothetical protein
VTARTDEGEGLCYRLRVAHAPARLHSRARVLGRQTMAVVNLGQLGYYTVSENAAVTLWNSDDQEFRPRQWGRSAPWLDKDNSPGVSIAIADTGS